MNVSASEQSFFCLQTTLPEVNFQGDPGCLLLMEGHTGTLALRNPDNPSAGSLAVLSNRRALESLNVMTARAPGESGAGSRHRVALT
jgi:hypothetical protein